MSEHERVLLQIDVKGTTHNIIMARQEAHAAIEAWKAAGGGKITVVGVIDHRDANGIMLAFDGSECAWMSIVDISAL